MADSVSTEIVGFLRSDISTELFQDAIVNNNLKLVDWIEIPSPKGTSLHSDILRTDDVKGDERITGMRSFELTCQQENGEKVSLKVALQSKKLDRETVAIIPALMAVHGNVIHEAFKKYIDKNIGIENCHKREILVQELIKRNPVLASLTPEVLHTLIIPEKDVYVSINRLICPEETTHFSATDDPEKWDRISCLKVIEGLARFHAEFLENYTLLGALDEILREHNRDFMEALPLVKLCLANITSLPHVEKYYTDKRVGMLNSYLARLEKLQGWFDQFPNTFIHGDAIAGEWPLKTDGNVHTQICILFCNWLYGMNIDTNPYTMAMFKIIFPS